MEKTVVFSNKDQALIEQIGAYQEAEGVPFEDAVKALCEIALTVKDRLTWGEF